LWSSASDKLNELFINEASFQGKMTIVIGIKTLEGAILAADCQITKGFRMDPDFRNKIQAIVGNSSELYLGMSGRVNGFFEHRLYLSDFIREVTVEGDDSYIDDIDSPKVLGIDESENRRCSSESRSSGNWKERARLNRIWDIYNVRRSTRLTGISYVGLRRSELKGIGLFTMINGEYSSRDAVCIGSGRIHVERELEILSQIPGHDDGLLFVSELMDGVLKDYSTSFGGYTILSVKEEERTKFAFDPNARSLELNCVKFETDGFPEGY